MRKFIISLIEKIIKKLEQDEPKENLVGTNSVEENIGYKPEDYEILIYKSPDGTFELSACLLTTSFITREYKLRDK